MEDRFFPNTMPSFVDKATVEESFLEEAKDSLSEVLYLPYRIVSEKFKRDDLDLKEMIMKETWSGVYVLGVVVAKHRGNEQLCDHYLTKFTVIELPIELLTSVPKVKKEEQEQEVVLSLQSRGFQLLSWPSSSATTTVVVANRDPPF
ncbi:hypothetical protein HAX54_013702 [Datura stramonium]|uniref:Uncharacterized protein n=1 Tax=Datura stramonium TaxID=4076 RepID=A0ABS8RYG8_DATST|nr:hypothetical protein [Datura stramonium]